MRHLKGFNQLFESQQDLTQEQKDWLDECTRNKNIGTWEINTKTGLVDIDGSFDCQFQRLRDFKGVRFGNVSGYFRCFGNSLTSLEGAPQHVGEDFDCSINILKSLKGAPKHVGKSFRCCNNELTSLKDAPNHVGWNFSCSNNELTSLEGAPQQVGNYVNCSNNHISGRVIEGVLKRMRDKKIPLEVAVAEYWRQIPQDDRVYLAKHHPSLPEKEKRIYRAIELNRKR